MKKGGGPNGTPSIEAYCPFGGLESLYQFITTGGFIRRIEPSAMIIFLAVIILTLLFSRGFCSWICPFGSIQEWLGMIGKKIFRKRYNPAGRVDNVLRYFKYVVLVFIIALTWWSGTMVFRDYDPFLAFFHLGEGIDEKPWGYGFLLVILIGSFYIDRFFCKYACPLGAVLGILGKFGITRVQRDPTDCTDCNLCHKKCHAHVEFLHTTEITSAECDHCLHCVVDCPKPNVLSVRGPKIRFSQPIYASMMIVGLFGMIGVSKATHTWRTKAEKVELTNSAGQLEPETIRGWMSLNEISAGFNVPLERLYADSGLPERVPPTAQIKNIHKEYEVEFEPDSVRQIVRALLEGDARFRPGSHKLVYAAPVTAANGPFRVTVEALYQSIKPSHTARMNANRSAEEVEFSWTCSGVTPRPRQWPGRRSW
ncbi:MAG: 4Fe-4S binding protein [bacterium]|nr:4Fe-4S binding protein [bacterium]